MKKYMIATAVAGMMLCGVQAQAASHQIVDHNHQYRAYLEELGNSGVKATVTMIPMTAKKTKIIAEMTGKNRAMPLNISINHGLCRDQNSKQAFALNPFHNGKSITEISSTPSNLFGETLAFYAVKSGSDVKHAVACGNMP